MGSIGFLGAHQFSEKGAQTQNICAYLISIQYLRSMFDCLLLLAVRTAAIAATPNCKTALKLSMLTHESIAQIGQKLKVMDCCNPD